MAISNKIAQNKDMSRRAKGLLVELLSHTDGWRTDSASLAAAGPEGRDAIRAMLRELEAHGYVRRIRRQDSRGLWRTDSYVFDEPVPPGYDPVELLSPAQDPDDFSTGAESDVHKDEIDGDEPETLFDEVAKPQVTPKTDFQSSVPPASDEPTPGDPDVGAPGAKNQKTNQNTSGVQVTGTSRSRERETAAPPKPATSTTASPGRPEGWDEYGPSHPWCFDHPGGTLSACSRCASNRENYDAAASKRRAAAKRAEDARAIEEARQFRIHGAADPASAADGLRRAREGIRAATAPQEATDALPAAQGAQEAAP